jgi:hypothetical protein
VKAPGEVSHSLTLRNLTQQATINSDSDGDGISEDTDNCRYAKNGLNEANPQQDIGGLSPHDKADGRGDVCQCGEIDGTGTITEDDVTKLREVLARSHVDGMDADERARCSVSSDFNETENGTENGRSCNIQDLVVLKRAFDTGSFPSVNGNPDVKGNVCRRASVQNLLPD